MRELEFIPQEDGEGYFWQVSRPLNMAGASELAGISSRVVSLYSPQNVVPKRVVVSLPFRCDQPRGAHCPRRGVQLNMSARPWSGTWGAGDMHRRKGGVWAQAGGPDHPNQGGQSGC